MLPQPKIAPASKRLQDAARDIDVALVQAALKNFNAQHILAPSNKFKYKKCGADQVITPGSIQLRQFSDISFEVTICTHEGVILEKKVEKISDDCGKLQADFLAVESENDDESLEAVKNIFKIVLGSGECSIVKLQSYNNAFHFVAVGETDEDKVGEGQHAVVRNAISLSGAQSAQVERGAYVIRRVVKAAYQEEAYLSDIHEEKKYKQNLASGNFENSSSNFDFGNNGSTDSLDDLVSAENSLKNNSKNYQPLYNNQYFLMEKGQPLDSYLRENTLSHNDKINLAIGVWRAIQEYHSGTVRHDKMPAGHKDIKPENFIVKASGDVVLLDPLSTMPPKTKNFPQSGGSSLYQNYNSETHEMDDKFAGCRVCYLPEELNCVDISDDLFGNPKDVLLDTSNRRYKKIRLADCLRVNDLVSIFSREDLNKNPLLAVLFDTSSNAKLDESPEICCQVYDKSINYILAVLIMSKNPALLSELRVERSLFDFNRQMFEDLKSLLASEPLVNDQRLLGLREKLDGADKMGADSFKSINISVEEIKILEELFLMLPNYVSMMDYSPKYLISKIVCMDIPGRLIEDILSAYRQGLLTDDFCLAEDVKSCLMSIAKDPEKASDFLWVAHGVESKVPNQMLAQKSCNGSQSMASASSFFKNEQASKTSVQDCENSASSRSTI